MRNDRTHLRAILIVIVTVASTVMARDQRATDISGHWTGYALQGPGGTRPQFTFEMWLEQEGVNVSGRAKVAVMESPQYYGVMSVSGTMTNGRFAFQEGALLENRPEPGTWWCIKRGALRLSDDEGLPTLDGKWTAGSCAPGSIHMTRQTTICDDDRIVSDYDPADDDYHHYGDGDDEIVTAICKAGSRCRPAQIFDLMLSQARFIAPTSDRQPVVPCKTTRVRIGPTTDNYVRTTVDAKSLAVTNYTLEKLHRLHPGRVTRTIIERDGIVYVRTEGEGTGSWPSVNELFAPGVWRGVDEELRGAYEAATSKQ